VAESQTLEQLQSRLADFRDERDWAQFHSPSNLAAAIAVEAGELQELFLWSADGSEVVAERRTDVEHELADVLIQALNLANPGYRCCRCGAPEDQDQHGALPGREGAW
jgi:NTP pyrophosphatase (non-canonical NTP hydrolase)